MVSPVCRNSELRLSTRVTGRVSSLSCSVQLLGKGQGDRKMTMTAFEVVEITVCVDCALLSATGEVTDGNGKDISERVAAGQVEQWGTDAWDIHLSDNDEPWFSWQACEGCGSTLGGDRMHAVVFVHE